jgi:hypothetical protein
MDPLDHFAIRELYALYAHRMDAGDAEGWADLFTPDGSWERVDEPGGPAVFSVVGHDALTTFARDDYAGRGSGTARHWMGNIVLEGEPPQVRGRTYGFLLQLVGTEIRFVAHGDFEDDLVKTADGWQFARRAVRLLNKSDIPSESG